MRLFLSVLAMLLVLGCSRNPGSSPASPEPAASPVPARLGPGSSKKEIETALLGQSLKDVVAIIGAPDMTQVGMTFESNGRVTQDGSNDLYCSWRHGTGRIWLNVMLHNDRVSSVQLVPNFTPQGGIK